MNRKTSPATIQKIEALIRDKSQRWIYYRPISGSETWCRRRACDGQINEYFASDAIQYQLTKPPGFQAIMSWEL